MSTVTIPASIGHGLIEMIFRDDSRQTELEPLCRKVLEKFQLPQRSLICIFDDEERLEFLDSPSLGENYCGFFAAVRQFILCELKWPPPILNHVHNSDMWNPAPKGWHCDVVIYLRRWTCDSPIGTVITFAHELQHFRQYGFSYKVWRAEGLVRIVYLGEPLAGWRLPCEHEAHLVSKKVVSASDVLGREVVMSYAEQQGKGNDPEKWNFFKGLDLEESFDVLERLKPWVNEYKEALKERFHANSSEEPYFTKDNWWE